ncbi:glycosyltransferase family 2 protein [Pseudobutyrivibrio sp. LB2011]|uniref:glycosyltransferase family 2 protein n=1 Tax=Pseudobutyrivibrio sp. LB2011 TaxID=1408312 RepID=UPI0005D21E2A|nr:glycosyltransferase [Pseudobutyrivibrio sp. LB2011]
MSDNNTLISVIMGAYNASDTIAEAIESIISQTYDNWELIICDDCSIDNTYQIIEEYTKKDKRIIALKNDKNMRLAATLNRCLEIAQGSYIARMDADDLSLPDRFMRQIRFLEDHPQYDCVGCGRMIFDSEGKHGIRRSKEYPSKSDLLFDTPFAHPTIMMKKEVYDSLNGYTVSKETMRAEDLDLWFRFYAKGYTGYNIPDVLYMYREGKEDLKKRSIKAGVQTAKVFYNGYKLIGVPIYKRILCIKPIISAVVPKSIMVKYYSKWRGQ